MRNTMYERLTKWEVNGCASVNGCSPIDKDMANAINRLCEIEDKICEGTMLELPCEIGQTVYCIRYDKARKPFVKPLGVCSVTVWGKGGLTVFTTKEDSWGVTAFATPEEAEAKLREMEGDNNE